MIEELAVGVNLALEVVDIVLAVRLDAKVEDLDARRRAFRVRVDCVKEANNLVHGVAKRRLFVQRVVLALRVSTHELARDGNPHGDNAPLVIRDVCAHRHALRQNHQ